MVSAFVSVSVPYEITLLSNRGWFNACGMPVSVPYEITLLSNYGILVRQGYVFQYLMKLHYSQTGIADALIFSQFQYLMKLHYSQTRLIRPFNF